jgi:hypothetical protein
VVMLSININSLSLHQQVSELIIKILSQQYSSLDEVKIQTKNQSDWHMQWNFIKTNLQVLKYKFLKVNMKQTNNWYSIFCKLHCHARSEVLMEFSIKITVLSRHVYATLRWSRFLRNVDGYLPGYTASRPKNCPHD